MRIIILSVDLLHVESLFSAYSFERRNNVNYEKLRPGKTSGWNLQALLSLARKVAGKCRRASQTTGCRDKLCF